jgi:uncharacterized protein YkwD
MKASDHSIISHRLVASAAAIALSASLALPIAAVPQAVASESQDAVSQAVSASRSSATYATLVSAQSKVDVAQSKLSAAQDQYNQGSYAFFQQRGSTKAVNVFNDTSTKANSSDARANVVMSGTVHLGSSTDATSLDNMTKSLDMLKEFNEIRASEGLPELQVSDYLMAVSQVHTDWGVWAIRNYGTFDHSRAHAVGENIAFGYADPFDGWYTQEKALYNKAVANGQTPDYEQVGHYLNIVDKGYTTTGFSYSSNGRYCGQVFGFNVSGADTKSNLSDYRARFDAYVSGLNATISADKAELAAAQAAYGALFRTVSPFTDVDSTTPHALDIVWLSDNGISTGYNNDDGTASFQGMTPVYRQDMAAFLRREAKLFGIGDAATWTPSADDWNAFTDVNASTPHAEDILWLAHAGISQGYANGDGTYSFGGMTKVYRQDMAAFLHRMAKLGGFADSVTPSTAFAGDSSVTSHADDVAWLAGAQITIGYSDGTFQGMWSTYRQDMAAFLHRFNDLKA